MSNTETLPQSDCIGHGLRYTYRGYGMKWHKGKNERAHRLAYCAAHGLDIKDIAGLVVRHTCDNPGCVNPGHLLIGTHADNNRDRGIRRRHGSLKLTNEQVAEIRATCTPSRPGIREDKSTSYSSLGRKYGVSSATVRKVYLRESFKHLP